MKISKKNLITQTLSWIFLAFTFSGFDIVPDELATRIVENLSNGQFFALLTYLLINVGNVAVHWYQTLKNDPKSFWKFVESVNFWMGGVNILLGLILMKWGIPIDPKAVESFIGLIFSKEYWEAGTVLIMNILIPILKIIIKPKDRK